MKPATVTIVRIELSDGQVTRLAEFHDPAKVRELMQAEGPIGEFLCQIATAEVTAHTGDMDN